MPPALTSFTVFARTSSRLNRRTNDDVSDIDIIGLLDHIRDRAGYDIGFECHVVHLLLDRGSYPVIGHGIGEIGGHNRAICR